MADTNTKLALCGALSHYLDSSDLSDFTIVCQTKSWKTHRLLLSLHSKVLAKSCNGDFVETKDRQIDLSEYASAHVEALVSYLYKWDYDDTRDLQSIDVKLTFHTHVCFIADKYDIKGLKQLSIKKFDALLPQVKKGNEMAEAAKLAYSGPSAVTAICLSIVSKINSKNLIGVDTESKELEKVMEVYPQLAIDTLRARASSKENAVAALEASPESATLRYRCPGRSCGAVNYFDYFPTSGSISCKSCDMFYTGDKWRMRKM